jgi:hypothetical protein
MEAHRQGRPHDRPRACATHGRRPALGRGHRPRQRPARGPRRSVPDPAGPRAPGEGMADGRGGRARQASRHEGRPPSRRRRVRSSTSTAATSASGTSTNSIVVTESHRGRPPEAAESVATSFGSSWTERKVDGKKPRASQPARRGSTRRAPAVLQVGAERSRAREGHGAAAAHRVNKDNRPAGRDGPAVMEGFIWSSTTGSSCTTTPVASWARTPPSTPKDRGTPWSPKAWTSRPAHRSCSPVASSGSAPSWRSTASFSAGSGGRARPRSSAASGPASTARLAGVPA